MRIVRVSRKPENLRPIDEGIEMTIITGKKLITASELVHAGLCEFWGLIINSQDTGDFIRVYEGQDVGSGEKIIDVDTRKEYVDHILLPKGIEMSRGLYVELDDGIENVTVLYTPIHSDDNLKPNPDHIEV